jgi:hypothetical protein
MNLILLLVSKKRRAANLASSLSDKVSELLDLSKWNIYTSCNDLPYDIFKKCCVDKKYSLLGDAPEYVLQRAWLEIYSEYALISEDENIRDIIDQLSQIIALESKLFRVRIFCTALLDHHNDFIAKKIRELGYNYKFTKESYLSDIEKVLQRLKNIEVDIKLLTQSIENLTGKDKDQELSYAMFDERINEIERAFKVPINTDTLKAQMYGLKIRDLKRYYRKLEDQNTSE